MTLFSWLSSCLKSFPWSLKGINWSILGRTCYSFNLRPLLLFRNTFKNYRCNPMMIIFKFTFSTKYKYISILYVCLHLSQSSIWFQGKLDRFNNTSKERVFHVHSFLGIGITKEHQCAWLSYIEEEQWLSCF